MKIRSLDILYNIKTTTIFKLYKIKYYSVGIVDAVKMITLLSSGQLV